MRSSLSGNGYRFGCLHLPLDIVMSMVNHPYNKKIYPPLAFTTATPRYPAALLCRNLEPPTQTHRCFFYAVYYFSRMLVMSRTVESASYMKKVTRSSLYRSYISSDRYVPLRDDCSDYAIHSFSNHAR